MNRLVIAVLFLAIAGACALPGCQSDQKAIEQAIADLELTSSGDFKDFRPAGAILAKDADDVVTAIDHIYHARPHRDLRANAAATLALLGLQRQTSTLKGRMGRLAEQMLFDKDPIVAKKALDVLFSVKHPGMEDLLRRRLQEPIHKDILRAILFDSAWHKLYNVILAEISLPRPASDQGNLVQEWFSHVKAGVEACRMVDDQLPADFGPRLVALVSQDADLRQAATFALAEARPEGAVSVIKAELEKTTLPSTRLALETALLVLDSENPALSEAALGQLKDAARRFRSMPEWWPEVVVRTRWLAYASFHRTDDSLLRGIWASIDGLQPRDKGELLSIVVSQYSGSYSSKRASTNRFILFLDTLPPDELKQMATLWPDLRLEVTSLLSLAAHEAHDALPDLITRVAMDAAAQRLAEQMK